ncbi:MAG: K(+)-transporting ATPase subunit F [Alphaproteobacteria bacterium]|nr:K(+)-transporting ATPase subunit F [Alphaproteobacteria bacterium]MBV8411288.1 K(+)-transporting ATPase subunit F [Alphaproteobacteria bacterium]
MWCRPATSDAGADMASWALLALLVGLVIYLFYAVIHPERF